MTGRWLAIACVIASVIGLVLLLVDIRRGASAGKVADAPTTGAFLGEDVDAFVAQREARRDSGHLPRSPEPAPSPAEPWVR